MQFIFYVSALKGGYRAEDTTSVSDGDAHSDGVSHPK